jgi:glycosyltransferase involved in cell wall biosynthesis
MTKTIWYISKYFSTGLEGSIGSRSWLFLKHFASRGMRVWAISSDSNHLGGVPRLSEPIKIESLANVNIVWLRTYKYSIAKSASRILSWLHFELNVLRFNKNMIDRPDVVIVSSLSLLTVLNGVILKWRYKCKLVFEVRDIWPLTIVEEGGFGSWNPFVLLLGFIERLGYNSSDLIVGTMPNLAQHVAETTGVNANVVCMPMVLDEEMMGGGVSVAGDYVDTYLRSDYFNIVHAGTIGIANSLETFLRAAEVLISNERIRFVLIGDGALKDYYLKKYGHLPNVVFAPKVQKNQVQSVLSEASLVYFATYKSKVWDYGQSLNKLIDYMLSGKPILASYSGYPSMLDEAGCGYFVPAEDVGALVRKIEEISLLTTDELVAMGRRGRNWVIENRYYKRVGDDYLRAIFPDDASVVCDAKFG